MKKKAELPRGRRVRRKRPGAVGHPEWVRAKAKVLFVSGNHSILDTAKKAEVCRATIYSWADAEDWWSLREERLKEMSIRGANEVAETAIEEIKRRHATTAKLAHGLGSIGLNAALRSVTAPDGCTPKPPEEVLKVLPPKEARRLMKDGELSERLVHGLDQGRLSLSLTAGQHETEQRYAGRVRALLREGKLSMELARELLEDEAVALEGGEAEA